MDTERVERGHKRVRTYLAGELVADTLAPVQVWEWPFYPAYYIPAADVRAELRASETDPDRHDVVTAHHVAPAAGRNLWKTGEGESQDLVRLDWAVMDEWFEEDEPVYVHPRDPGVRIDVLASSRHVVV